MHYIHYITCIIYDISSTLYDVTSLCVLHHTMTLSMISNPIWLWHIWHHTQCYDHTTIVCLHRHYAWHYPQCILTLHTMYQCYEKKWLHVITASICMTPYAIHMTSHPLFLKTHHSLCVMAHTLFMTSYVLYMMSPILCVWLRKLYIWIETC